METNSSLQQTVATKEEMNTMHQTATVPKLGNDRFMTTVVDEVEQFRVLTEMRLRNANFIRLSDTAEQIFAILKKHCEDKIKIHEATRQELLQKIRRLMTQEKPILITLSFAIGCRILNPLKFREAINLPHLGWMHLFWFFSFMNEKVKKFYPPGIQVAIFDEAMLLAEKLGIADQAEINACLAATNVLIERMKAPVIILPMPKDDFPENVLTATHIPLDNARIYSYLCSMREMNDPSVMDVQYLDRQHRDYDRIRRTIGPLWKRAKTNAYLADQYFTYRKHSRLFAKWLGTNEYLDATLTDKDERLVFDITRTLINHGMPCLRRTKNEYHLEIHPEYRIEPACTPVYLDPNELGLSGGHPPFVFYYRS